MNELLKKIRRRLSILDYRKNYYLSKLLPTRIRFSPLRYIPDGFSVTTLANTGIKVIDNFCTADEANYLIEKARKSMIKSRVIVDGKAILESGRTSSHAVVHHRYHQDPKVLSIIARAAMLIGVPLEHAEQIYVTRYGPGEFYHGHYDFSDDYLASHRLCTLLVYLNDLEESQGGVTYFRDLNVAMRPWKGRAACWTNINPDGSIHRETLHAALPIEDEDAEKWVMQVWFRPYKMHKLHQKLDSLQSGRGQPLSSNDELPDGVWLLDQAN
ncbi:MAG: 2OG-Fe(II) oxygenase [Gammaproteobacteria bacterium]|jgi:prolyl 4-hydroxylase|nr:2OG-Fe(II) oxygenase [Gammaproteobacteria bacterium]MDP6617593.1 2OG-Fe(II) oxygenase [Gammaproteobacteria bacterium]MDP6694470.1 2OG-Fe(II) oxygenase [Gammaproteobacteria bacterium]